MNCLSKVFNICVVTLKLTTILYDTVLKIKDSIARCLAQSDQRKATLRHCGKVRTEQFVGIRCAGYLNS